MVNTSTYPVTVDGVRLDTFAWNVETKQGRDASPGMQGSNVESAQTDGEIWVPNKRAAPGRAVLSMWVGGTDADGVVPADSYLKYRQNLDQLYRMFSVTHRLLDVRQQLDVAGAQIRQALCEVGAIIDPEMLTNFPYTGKFAVELKIPGAFWQSVADVNYDSAAGLVANTDINLPVFAPSTAPMRKQYVVLDGPATNPKLIDNRNGHWVQLFAAIPNGQQWVLNTALWTSKTGTGIAFTQGGNDVFAVTQFGGGHSPSLFGITADPAGPQIRIEGSGFGAGTRLRIRGKLQYL